MTLSEAEIAARLAEVRRSYIASLQEKHDTLARHWMALCTQWDPEAYQALYMSLHSLAGSAETFGLADLSRYARKLVDDFKQHPNRQPISPEVFQNLRDDFDRVLNVMQKALAENRKT